MDEELLKNNFGTLPWLNFHGNQIISSCMKPALISFCHLNLPAYEAAPATTDSHIVL